MKRKILSFVVLSVIILNLFIIPAGAASAASGTCGENLTWILESDGTLSISGTGAMTDWGSNIAPWYSQRASVKKVVIKNGVTGVGGYAFYDCTNLKSVTFSESIVRVGKYAFKNCTGLTTINLPSSVTDVDCEAFYNTGYYNNSANWEDGVLYIGNHLVKAKDSVSGHYTVKEGTLSINYGAFVYCKNLTNITFPESLISVKERAFRGCTGLTEVVIPNGVTSIGEWAFMECTALTYIVIPDSVTKIGGSAFYESGYYKNENNWENGVLYIGNHLINTKTTISGSYAVKEGTVSLAVYAFQNCSALTNVTIPESIKSIGEYAFQNCAGLEEITIPGSVKSINNDTFQNCTGLTNVTLSKGVTDIGWEVFYGCSNLKKVSIPDSVTSIGNSAFARCTALNNIKIPSSVKELGISVFQQCTSLTDITLPNSIISMGYGVFSSCSALKNVTLPENITGIPNNTFYGCTSLMGVIIPDKVTTIGSQAFRNCTALINITIPDSVTSIDSYAYYGCSALTGITVPDSVTSVGWYSFYGCSSLETVSLSENLTVIDSYLFDGCLKLKSITVPHSVTKIGSYAFNGCTNLEAVNIGGGTTNIDWYAFSSCSNLENINVSVNNSTYSSVGGVVYNKEKTELIRCPVGKTGELIIPDAVTSIKPYAFSGCAKLEKIVVGNGITNIVGNTFSGCNSPLEITIPKDATVIQDMAFQNCKGLTDIIIPDGVTTIGNSAFSGCTGLKSITIPSSVTSIKNSAFSQCLALTDVHYTGTMDQWWEITINTGGNSKLINATIHTVGDDESFDVESGSCGENVNWVLDSEGTLTISGSGDMENYESGTRTPWFSRRGYIKKVVIENGVTGIGDYAFFACEVLNEVSVPNSVTSIGKMAFDGDDSLTEIIIPESVKTIGYRAFGYCENLTNITMPDTVTDIGGSVIFGTGYYNDESNWENEVLYLGNHLIEARAALSGTYEIKNGTVGIAQVAFMQCDYLTEVIMPNSITVVGKSAFSGCFGLERVVLSNNLTTIGKYVFANCCSLTSITLAESTPRMMFFSRRAVNLTIPDSITNIEDGAFSYCENITSLTVPDSVKTLGESSFGNCVNLTSVSLGNGIENVGDSAFLGCNNLVEVNFSGTKEQWKKVKFGKNNETVTNATVYFNGESTEEPDGPTEPDEPDVPIEPEEPEKIYRIGLDADGYYRYYIDGVVQTKWQVAADGYKYYFSTSSSKYGAAMTGTNIKIGSSYYDFTQDGKLIESYDASGAPVLYYDETMDIRLLVTYDYKTNGGTASDAENTKVFKGELADLTATAEKEGYTFVGWNTDKNATNGLETYSVTGNVTLYAIYEKNAEEDLLNGVILCDDGYYRYYVEGEIKTGWQITPDGYKYYFSSSASKYGAAMTGTNKKIGSAYYDFTEEGKLIEGYDENGNPILFRSLNGFITDEKGITRYYVDNEYVIGWNYINGYKYYFSKSNGRMLTGFTQIGSLKYNLDVDGHWIGYYQTEYTEEESPKATEVVKDSDGKYRYYVNGETFKGWKVLKAENGYYKYYFSKSDGGAVTTYATQVGSEVYDFRPTGTLITVTRDENGNAVMSDYKLSLEQGAKNGIVLDADGKYRYYIDGEYQTGWQDVNGNRYLFKKADGSAITTTNYRYGSYYYNFSEDGKLLSKKKA